MSLNSQFTPQATDKIFDPLTGQLTEIGRILIRTLSEQVGALAPITAPYWTSTAEPALTNERNLGALASGYLKIVTAIGIATPSTVALIPQADVSGLVAALAVLTSGVYTPTLFNDANLTGSTAYSCQFLRVGNTVTVSGRVDVDPTTTATLTTLGISLPIASAFANTNECGGTAWASAVAGEGAAIFADAANDRATMQWVAVDVTNAARFFSFTYRII